MRVYEGEPVGLIEDWAGADAVIVVDAVSSGAPPGTIHRLDPLAEPIPAALSQGSTHAFGLAETIELARTLDRLPPRLTRLRHRGRALRRRAASSARRCQPPSTRSARSCERLLGKSAADGRQDPDAGARGAA